MSTKTTIAGATVGPDLSGLKVSADNTSQINEFEAANIASATVWGYKSRKIKKELLTVTGLLALHERMYSDVWDWAGKIRTEELNIGVKAHQIQNELGRVLGDVQYRLEHKTYPLDDICMRFHHELTRIHPFKNGNGRFARLAANLLAEHNGGKRFTWGSMSLVDDSPNRDLYIAALKLADKTSEVTELLTFARS